MANDSEFSVQYFVKSLVEQIDVLAPVMKKLHDAPTQLTARDLVDLREELDDIRAIIELLDESNDQLLAEKKTKRRFNPFKK